MFAVPDNMDSRLVLQFAKGTEALMLADKLTAIERTMSEDYQKAAERYQLDLTAIAKQYAHAMRTAVQEFNQRVDALTADSDMPEDADDEL